MLVWPPQCQGTESWMTSEEPVLLLCSVGEAWMDTWWNMWSALSQCPLAPLQRVGWMVSCDSGLANWHNPIPGHHDGFVEGHTGSRWCIWDASEDVGLERLAATCYHMESETEDPRSSRQQQEASLITSFWLLSPAGFENLVRAIHHARQYISYFCFW